MASSSSSPSALISSSQSWKYDVFLSFKGDTRKTFVDHLYKALVGNRISTYKDDQTLPQGEQIGPTLEAAIEESQMSLIIFSVNYANSTWCLNELKHIMKCREERKQTVLPIFYDVEPSKVRHQKEEYKEAFEKYELENKKKIISLGQSFMNNPLGWLYAPLEQYREYTAAAAKQELENSEKVGSWKRALKDASDLSGWETKLIANGYEAEGIEKIVGEILLRLNLETSGANENLIGMMTRVQDLKSELQIESGGVRMVGIWGVGGGGKTTLASSIYDEISSMYDGCCFVDNIGVESSNGGLKKLQEKIISGILKQKQVQEVGRVEEGRCMIKARLRHKKVLIVLDDVNRLDQLEALVGSHDWFHKGTRIIITTRNEQLLNAHGVDVIHQISLLNNDEAIRLFHKHALRDCTPTEDFEKLSEEVLTYAGRLPLALKVLGSFLCGRNSMQWRSALDKLKDIPHKDIIGILRISFDGLEQYEKDLFLDIACFFRWEDTSKAMKLLNACGSHSVIGVEVLRQKALIVILENGTFDMHDLVQDMGHYIVREKHPRNPEKHSRVWKWEDVSRILAMDATTKLDNIEAIRLPYPVTYEESQHFLRLVGNMNKLRWLDLNVYTWDYWSRDKIILPLPEKFPPTQLCFLKITNGIPQEQLWNGYKVLPYLTHMELDSLYNLIMIPDFAGLTKIETFKLRKCPCLEEIHPSIGCLESLVYLSVQDCPHLRKFPSITRISKLETLEFFNCNKLEIISEDMDNLPHLHLDNNGKEVASCTSPHGVECCLPHYNLNHRRLHFSHSSLRKLILSRCCLKDNEIDPDVWELPNLEELDLSRNPLISRLDFSILQLPQLKWLDVSYCTGLVELSELPSSIAIVIADFCDSLESFGDVSNCKWLWNVSLAGENQLDQHHGYTLIDSMLEGNASEDYFINVALEGHVPNGMRLFRGNTFRLHLPDDWYNDYCGFLICIVTDAFVPRINITIKHESPPFDLLHEFDEVEEPEYSGNKTCVGYVSFSSLRHTTLLTSSYNIISIAITDMYDDDEGAYVKSGLIPRKSISGEEQTTYCSEFWYQKLQDESLNTFRIQQYDSDSSVQITWKPFS